MNLLQDRYVVSCPTSLCDACSRPALSLQPRRDAWLCPSCALKQAYTTYEIAGRDRKVKAATAILHAMGLTPEEFSRMTEGSWALLAAEVRKQYGMNVEKFSVESRHMIAQALNDARGVSSAA